MENGLNEVILSALSLEVKPVKIVSDTYSNNNGNAPNIQTSNPTKKDSDLMFIDDGFVFPSSSSEKQCLSSGNGDVVENILRGCIVESPSSPPPSPTLTKACHMTSTCSRRLPTVVVLGYQRVVAESQAAAERMHQQQQHFLQRNPRSLDCPLTLSLGSGGSFDQGLPVTPHGRNNRVNCPLSDDLHYFTQLSAPQSPPSNTSSDFNAIPFPSPLPSTTVPDINSSNESKPTSSPCRTSLGSRPAAEDTDAVAESVYHQPPKAADRSAAYRLARRLFTLDGFKITDVAKHLCKRNDFSQLVGEEFMSFFNLTDQTIDTALRYFMTKFALTGESQDRERILFHFSRRYVTCNPSVFASEDACHTLVCALMLLNTDLHNQNVTRKMSCQEFVSNLLDLNNGGNGYSLDELKRLYDAFKQEPLRWPVVEVPTFNLMYGVPPVVPASPLLAAGVYGFGMNGLATPNDLAFISPTTSGTDVSTTFAASTSGSCVPTLGPSAAPYWQTAADPSLLAAWTTAGGSTNSTYFSPAVFTPNQVALTKSASLGAANTTDNGDLLKLFTNPFADMPKDISAKEYMRGFVMRKCVMQSNGKRTAMGKRNWKLFYARLRDLALYFYKDAETAAAATRAEEMALGYMKHIYHFQLHCQHLRFYHEHQQRLQAALVSSTPPSAGDTRSLATENRESASKADVGKADNVEATDKIDNDGVEAEKNGLKSSEKISPSPQVAPQMPSPNGVPGISSVLEQQLMTAAFQLPPPPPPPPPPEGVICIAHAFACIAEGYTKKPNVYRLKTKDGSEFLMQVNDAKELQYWVDKINYVAGLLSAPSLPSAVGSDQIFHRPILPSAVTHLRMHDQLEGHRKRIEDLTRDLTDLRRRRMSAPSQPNLTCLTRDSTAPSPAPSIRSESATREDEVYQQLQQPPSSQLPYIPNSVLKSLTPSSATTLPSSATYHPERSIASTFSTASLGRRRKKSFSTLRAGTCGELAAQRAELDERVAFLEHELTRYKTYTCLLEAELSRLQRLPAPQSPSSPHLPSTLPVCSSSPQVRGFWQVCGSADLSEEPPGCHGNGEGWKPTTVVASLPPQAKRGYSPSMGFGNYGGMRQSQSHRMHYRHYQMQRRQQQQQILTPSTCPCPPLSSSLTVQCSHKEEEAVPLTLKVENTSQELENPPGAFYEVL